jgi:hypothetical protein
MFRLLHRCLAVASPADADQEGSEWKHSVLLRCSFDTDAGATSLVAVPLADVKRHVESRNGWFEMFRRQLEVQCRHDVVDGQRCRVEDWPLHLLRPFGSVAACAVLN